MADVKQAPKKILARCGERVVFARLSNMEGAYLFQGGGVLREAGQTGDGRDVTAMALHPWGLAVVAKAGAHAGKKVVIPSANVAFAIVADEEN